jgi:hypothetical protein
VQVRRKLCKQCDCSWGDIRAIHRFLLDLVSPAGHRCRHGRFDHPFDASDPSKDLGLEWAEVGGRVDAAAMLEPTHSGESGIVFALGNILVWLTEVAQKRACFQTEACFERGVQEVDTHSCLPAGQRNLGSARTGEDPGSVRKSAAEVVAGIHIHTAIHESATHVRREMWKVAGTVVVWQVPEE